MKKKKQLLMNKSLYECMCINENSIMEVSVLIPGQFCMFFVVCIFCLFF